MGGNGQATVATVVLLAICSGAVNTLVAGWLLHRRVTNLPPPTQDEGGEPDPKKVLREVLSISLPLLVVTLVMMVRTNGDVWILGASLPQGQLALYGAANRLVSMVTMPMVDSHRRRATVDRRDVLPREERRSGACPSQHGHAYWHPGLDGVGGVHLFRRPDTGSGIWQLLPRRRGSTGVVEYRAVRKRLLRRLRNHAGIYWSSEDVDGNHHYQQCRDVHCDVRSREALRHSRRGDGENGGPDTAERHRVACGQAEDQHVDPRGIQGNVSTMENHEVTGQATVLYIGGHGRSGSTILAQTLGQIPGFVNVGELWQIWHRGLRENERCGCGQLFHSCEFWRAVGDEAFGGWQNVDVDKMVAFRPYLKRRRYAPHFALAAKTNVRTRQMNALLEEGGPVLERLHRAIQTVSGAEVIVDSSKRFSYAVLLSLLPFADLRVVHLVRDSRAVAYSWRRSKESPAVVGGRLMPRLSPAQASRVWSLQNYAFSLPFEFYPPFAPSLRGFRQRSNALP